MNDLLITKDKFIQQLINELLFIYKFMALKKIRRLKVETKKTFVQKVSIFKFLKINRCLFKKKKLRQWGCLKE